MYEHVLYLTLLLGRIFRGLRKIVRFCCGERRILPTFIILSFSPNSPPIISIINDRIKTNFRRLARSSSSRSVMMERQHLAERWLFTRNWRRLDAREQFSESVRWGSFRYYVFFYLFQVSHRINYIGVLPISFHWPRWDSWWNCEFVFRMLYKWQKTSNTCTLPNEFSCGTAAWYREMQFVPRKVTQRN